MTTLSSDSNGRRCTSRISPDPLILTNIMFSSATRLTKTGLLALNPPTRIHSLSVLLEPSKIVICSIFVGDPAVKDFEGSHLVFVAAGLDPFDVITNTMKIVERRLQTFSLLERKKMPDMLNWFGLCTWDAFYTEVTFEGVKQGLESFEKGGISPKFVIIDDGWQSVGMDPSSYELKMKMNLYVHKGKELVTAVHV